MEVGLSILLKQVGKFVVNNLEFNFFCLYLSLNFKPYFIMASKVVTEDMLKFSGSVDDPIISVVISNYPLANGGYLVSFSQEGPDGSFESYDPVNSLDFEASKLSKFLEITSIFLPKGCYYLPEMELAAFIKSLSSGVSAFGMKLLPASAQMQALFLVTVNERSLMNYEQKEEASR